LLTVFTIGLSMAPPSRYATDGKLTFLIVFILTVGLCEAKMYLSTEFFNIWND